MSTLTLPTVEGIEHLDFEPTIPCESPQHAMWGHTSDATLLTESWHSCGRHGRMTLCVDCWTRYGQAGVYCDTCNEFALNRDDWMRIVQVLR